MPALIGLLGELNIRFSEHRIHELVSERSNFLPEKQFAETLADIVAKPGTPNHQIFQAFVEALPQAFQNSMGAMIHHGLSVNPPTLVNWSWAPGYDYELTINYVPEPPPEPSGLFFRLKTRYPEDAHPMA